MSWYNLHYNDVIMSTMASQITSLMIVYSNVYSRHRSKKTSKLCVTGLCERNSQVAGEFPAQRASDTENVSIWWCHHVSKRNISKTLHLGDAYMHQWPGPLLFEVMTDLFVDKPWSDLILTCQLNPEEQTSGTFQSKYQKNLTRKCIWKCLLQNVSHLFAASRC